MNVRIEPERVTKTLYTSEPCAVAVGDAVAFACAFTEEVGDGANPDADQVVIADVPAYGTGAWW